MIKTFLIFFLIFIIGCTLSVNTNIDKTYLVDVPYYLHFKNNSSTEKSTIKITKGRDSIIFETTSDKIEERQQRGNFKISGKYCVIVSFLDRNPAPEFRTDFTVEKKDKRIEIGLNIHSEP